MKLQTTYLGIPLENPFILASAPPTADAEMLLRAFAQGWAGAVVKTMIREPVRNVRNRFSALKMNRHLLGFQNFELLSERSPQQWFDDIRRLKREFPEKLIVSSIMGDAKSPDDWTELALGSQDAGADLLELNFSCPHGYPEKGQGAAIGQSAKYTALVVSWLKEDSRIRIPLVPKLTAATADISHIGEAAAQAGAAGLSGINTVPSFFGFDLRTLQPKPSVSGYSTTGGYSGPGIKPIALRCIHELAKSPGLPLMAGGGIFSGYDAAEFILLGAPLVQICTAVMWDGYNIISNIQHELEEFMQWHGFQSLAEFTGIGQRSIVSHAELDRAFQPLACIDQNKCSQCRSCLTSCRDAGYQAIRWEENRVLVEPSSCAGCSLCTLVCPNGAISLN